MLDYVKGYNGKASCCLLLDKKVRQLQRRFGLVWFYGISAIAGYLMPNPIYTYIIKYI